MISTMTILISSPASCRAFLRAWTWSARIRARARAGPRCRLQNPGGGLQEHDRQGRRHGRRRRASDQLSGKRQILPRPVQSRRTSKWSGTAPPLFTNRWARFSTVVPAGKVKATAFLQDSAEEYKEVRDLSQPTFKPGALLKMSAEAGPGRDPHQIRHHFV